METPVAKSLPQVFSNIAPDQYSRLVEKAKAAGIDLSGNIGTATKFGVEVSWAYSPEKQELVLECLRTPFFVKPEDVNARLQSLVKDALAKV
jgi:hypothetical protein